MKINYLDISEIPEDMREELSKACHAGEAESIYEKWADVCFVEQRSRSAVWMAA